MKKLLIAAFTLISLQTFAINWETIKGNGNVKKETREVSGYNGVSSHGPMDVQVSYGNSNSITVEADDNLLAYIETIIEGDKLIIRTKKGYNLQSKSKMVVNVSLTKLTLLNLSGSGNIQGDGAFNNNGKTTVSISGSGNIKFGFDSFDDLNISISGSGNIDLKGKKCNDINASVSGSGDIDCSNVSCNNVTAKVSGSGNIKANAANSVDAKVSGSGNVYYKGTASNINAKASGSGKVKRM